MITITSQREEKNEKLKISYRLQHYLVAQITNYKQTWIAFIFFSLFLRFKQVQVKIDTNEKK